MAEIFELEATAGKEQLLLKVSRLFGWIYTFKMFYYMIRSFERVKRLRSVLTDTET